MFNLLKKAPDSQTFLTLDIGSDAVKACVFYLEDKINPRGERIGRKATVLGFEKIGWKNAEAESLTSMNRMMDCCKQALQKAASKAGVQPQRMILGVGGDFVKGKTTVHRHRREDPEAKINLSELRNVVHKLEWAAFGKTRADVSQETGNAEIDIKLILGDVIDIRIDGYPVKNPLGFQGKEVQMSIFNAFSPYAYHKALQSIAPAFSLELLGVIPNYYALAQTVSAWGQGREEAGEGGIFVDVGGMSTDVSVVTEGILLGAKSFALGGKAFTKRLAMELNLSLEEAEKLKIAYSEDRLEQKSRQIVRELLQGDAEIWLEGVGLALGEFSQKRPFPSKIILLGGGAGLPEAREMLNHSKWYKSFNFIHKPEASFANPKDLLNVSDSTGKLSGHADFTTLALVNAGIPLSSDETLVQKALKKVTGIMQV